jgi:chromosome segregation ATPase
MTEQAPVTAEQLEEELRSLPAETEAPAKRQTTSDGADAGMGQVVRRLERDVAAAKQTEMKMLESLVRQTKELEQAKIALEEARLEVDALRQQQQGVAGAGAGPAPPPQQQWSVMDLMFGGVDEELNGLRARLRATSQAEERSRKAADDLTAALSAVTMEAKQVKAWLSDAQAELEAANAEADRLRGLLQGAEAELWSATEQVDAITSEWKDAAAGWRAREKALVARVRAAEEEAAAARRENADLAGARRALEGENDGLRRALERAAEDASAATEALELVSGENADLRDAAADKERDLEALRRENETLRAGEAAARERAKELEAQLLAAPAGANGGDTVGKGEIPLVEKWRREAAQGKLGAAAFLDTGRVLPPGRRDRMFASLSNLAELKSAAAAAAMDDDYDYEFDHLDVGLPYGGGGTEHAMKHKKRRSILRKFGDLFRRRSMYKPDLAPVLHNHY